MSAEAIRPVEETKPPEAREQARTRPSIGRWTIAGVSQVLLGFWAILVIFPFLWMLVTSLKTDHEILSSPWELPTSLQWDNFSRAWTEAHIGRFFFNTLIVLAGSLTGTLLVDVEWCWQDPARWPLT